jgi:hypothetical protein
VKGRGNRFSKRGFTPLKHPIREEGGKDNNKEGFIKEWIYLLLHAAYEGSSSVGSSLKVITWPRSISTSGMLSV